MKNICLFSLCVLMSCSELIDPPKNLIPKDKMAMVIADFALNEQINNITPNNNFENTTRFELQKHKIKGVDFAESYKYYTATRDLEEILNNAQEIVLDRDPAAKDSILTKFKENTNAPAFER
ncbi:DUF4296 domain-containing protein [Chryseobacterium sp. MP_3.2]|uniref:DUF4296 domain-containing protein n=1 Tax=Chryseobacterium sp. MP_3.2 TaxID=3071712 RepID=UPI002E033475|nr:hypothetical protein [Chryseobacterium sp. MP_3.2]